MVASHQGKFNWSTSKKAREREAETVGPVNDPGSHARQPRQSQCLTWASLERVWSGCGAGLELSRRRATSAPRALLRSP